MRRHLLLFLFLPLLLVILIGIPVPPVRASTDVQPFMYNPVFWQDWTYTHIWNTGVGHVWNQGNSSFTLNATDATDDANYAAVTISRFFATPEKAKDKETYEIMLRTPATGTTYDNATYFEFYYRYQNATTYHSFYLQIQGDRIRWYYYDGNGVVQSVSIYWSTYGQTASDYQTYTFILNNRLGTLQLQITNTAAVKWYDSSVSIQCVTQQLLWMAIDSFAKARASGGGYSFQSLIRCTQIRWVRANFPDVEGLRPWTLTGTNSTDSPYYLGTSGTTRRYATDLIMPFQGIKWLWNVTAIAGSDERASMAIEWYTFAGSRTGGCAFNLTSDGDLYLWTISSSGVWTNFLVKALNELRPAVGCAVWTEKSGKTYMYAQYTPHSSEYQDFKIYDISAYANLDSWGVKVSHTAWGQSPTTRGYSRINEMEIFYGLREGISQPRFGGMWWESNPIIMFFLGIANIIASVFFAVGAWIASALGPVISAVGSFLSPIITAVGTVINDVIGGILNTLIDVVNGLLDGFVTVFVPAFLDAVQTLINIVISICLLPLSAISLLLTGDPFVFVTAFFNVLTVLYLVFSWIGTALAGLATFFALIIAAASGHPIAVSGTAGTVIDLINRVL